MSDYIGQTGQVKPLYYRDFHMSLDVFGGHNGAAEETRTPDPIITNDVLYQLSYSGIFWLPRDMVLPDQCQPDNRRIW